MQPGLIIGAGPVGLAAALFLAHARQFGQLPHDFPLPCVVDENEADPKWSRALAVNPRTLDLLEDVGVTARMLELGQPVRGACLHRGGRIILEPTFEHLPARHPFMLALSQAESVRLLREAYESLGGTIERRTRLTRVSTDPLHAVLSHGPQAAHLNSDSPDARTSNPSSDAEQVVAPAWLLAADGAHSVARHSLNRTFDGSTLERPWNLVDVALDIDLPQDRAHIFLLDHESDERPSGFLFVMRVVDREHPRGGNFWRVMGNVDDVLQRLPFGRAVAEPEWKSSFHIAHRLIGQFAVGDVYFAGDAAHLHSPMGARGMNLGIEDAWVFAEALIVDKLDRYHALRHPVDAAVVRRINRATRLIIGESRSTEVLRIVALEAMKVRPLRQPMLRMLSGLDHDLPTLS